MPLWLVLQLQADPNRFARGNAVGGIRHQFGAHLLGGDHGFGIAGGGTGCGQGSHSDKKNSSQGAVKERQRCHEQLGLGLCWGVPKAAYFNANAALALWLQRLRPAL
ncbi:hypothetical protein GALL_468070 [mine drainage metagenome]|uniref:Uncharacterized protein n=1 Tax=mine drainage metagenome TaxID=410659 RepID=A0A1J5PJ12_9ZZZZ